MYDLINQFAQTVVGTIPPEHVTDYEWLLRNVRQASTSDYQKKYRRFWAMNAAQLSPAFYTTYFSTLATAMSHSPTLGSVAHTLHAASARLSGQKSLQFSFATKLLHMANPDSPIYDSQVAALYFFQEPSTVLQQRINGLVAFHCFLTQEYARVLEPFLPQVRLRVARSWAQTRALRSGDGLAAKERCPRQDASFFDFD